MRSSRGNDGRRPCALTDEVKDAFRGAGLSMCWWCPVCICPAVGGLVYAAVRRMGRQAEPCRLRHVFLWLYVSLASRVSHPLLCAQIAAMLLLYGGALNCWEKRRAHFGWSGGTAFVPAEPYAAVDVSLSFRSRPR